MAPMTRSAEATRQAFLEEGRALFIEAGVGRGLRTVPVAEVAKRLGRTTGAAYQIWERQEDFHHDLVTYILAVAEWTEAETLRAMVLERATTAAPDDLIRTSSQAYLESWISQRSSYLAHHFYALSIDDDDVRTAIRNGASRNIDSLVSVTPDILAVFGRKIRRGYSTLDLVSACSALTEGFKLFLLQHPDANRLIQREDRAPDSERWTLFSVSFEALLDRLTEPLTRTSPTGTAHQET
jgi:AcrR family transcriptional regulator